MSRGQFYKLVCVRWQDSRGLTPDWEFKEDLPALLPSSCETVGFLIDENAEFKTLAMTMSADQVLGRMTIPASAIRSIRELK